MARFVPALGWMPRYDRRWPRGDLAAGVAVTAIVVPKTSATRGSPACRCRTASTRPRPARSSTRSSARRGRSRPGRARRSQRWPVAPCSLTGARRRRRPRSSSRAIALVDRAAIPPARGFGWGGSPSSYRRRWSPGSWPERRSTSSIGELPKLTGTSHERRQRLAASCRRGSGSLGEIHWTTLLVGRGALAVILGLRFVAPKVPGALVLVVGGLLASAVRSRRARGRARRRRAARADRRPSCPASTCSRDHCGDDRHRPRRAAVDRLLADRRRRAGVRRPASIPDRRQPGIASRRGWRTSAPASSRGCRCRPACRRVR